MTGFQLLCCLYRSLCNIVLVLVRIWSEQKEEQDRCKDQRYDRSNSEGTGTCDNKTERAKAAKKEKKEKKRVFVPAEPAEDIIK